MDTSPAYARRIGVQILDAMLTQGRRIFTSADALEAAAALGVPESNVPRVLGKLTEGGWIRRARQGLYLIDETERGGPAPHPFAIATALVEPSAISHWSALAHHGLTEQVPRIVTASTTKDLITPSMRTGRRRDAQSSGAKRNARSAPLSVWDLGSLQIGYVRVKQEHFWGHEHVWIDEFSRVLITDRERTLLDGFVAPDVFGSLQEIMGALEAHLAEVDVKKLASYALRYGQGATIKRLGFVLEQLGADEEAIHPLLEAPVKGYRLLDPHAPERGPHVARWHIRDNLAP
jgi:predicted transcriptional regulator of viral defense system